MKDAGPHDRGLEECIDAFLDRAASEEPQGDVLRELADFMRAGPEQAALRPLQPGEVLGDFRLRRVVGEGGHSQVWEAEQLSVRRRVAVKILKAGVYSRADLGLFRAEAETVARLRHEGIVVVYGSGEVGGCPYIAEELVEGGRDLGAWVADRRRQLEASPGRALQADHVEWVATRFVRLCDALQAAHDQGVYHRDLKPQNILLRQDDQLLVADFGMAGSLGRTTGHTRRFEGSWPYLAPEQVEGRAVGKSPAIDVYQLGVTLYELLTLRRAFPGHDQAELLQRIKAGDVPPPTLIRKQIPFELEAICLHAMARDPDRRYASPGDLRDDVQRFLDGTTMPLAARATSHLGLRLRYVLRRRKLAVALAGAVLFGALAAVLLRGPPAAPPGIPRIRPYRFTSETGTLDPARPEAIHKVLRTASSELSERDLIGFDLRLDEPATLFVMTICGDVPARRSDDRGAATWVRPCRPAVVSAGVPKPDTAARFARRLDAGLHHVVVPRFDQRSDALENEGFLVVLVQDPPADMERWMHNMSRPDLPGDHPPGAPRAVTWHQAESQLTQMLSRVDRGGELALSNEALRILAALPPEGTLEDKWTDAGLMRFWTMWRLVD